MQMQDSAFRVVYKLFWSLGEFIPLSTRIGSKQLPLLISVCMEENKICVILFFICCFFDNRGVPSVPLWSIHGEQQQWFPLEPLSRGEMSLDLSHKAEIDSPS